MSKVIFFDISATLTCFEETLQNIPVIQLRAAHWDFVPTLRWVSHF